MYGLYQNINPPGFYLASIDPATGQITPVGSAPLSNAVNATGSTLNPYNQTFSFQDEDSWLSVDLQTGAVLNDVLLSLPNTEGNFDNFRFNTADSSMYGLYRSVSFDPSTGFVSSDIRLATCDLSSGAVNLISTHSIAESFTMSGSTIDPHQMFYHFESEGKFMGIDLYTGEIYSQPTISFATVGLSFDNFAYSCVDTAIYGLIMQNGIQALGKIDPQTGLVTSLPTILSFDNYILNSGGAIDPDNHIYYFQTYDSTGQIQLVGLSLSDGSVVSESYLGSDGYFIMYRIQSDCYRANRARFNLITQQSQITDLGLKIYPNPVQDILSVSTENPINKIEIMDLMGRMLHSCHPNGLNLQIPTTLLENGMYYLRISSANASHVERFIKN
jgi:hypothetical protein